MRLLTLRALKGCQFPPGPNDCYKGLNLSGMTRTAEEIFASGWSLAIRGQSLIFIAPVHDKKRAVYTKYYPDFDVAFEFGEDESIESLNRWDSHPAQEKVKK